MSLLAVTVVVGGFELSLVQLLLLSLPILYVLYTIAIHQGYARNNPIVWSWVPHLRSAALFGADPNTFLLKCKQQYGDIFTVNLGGKKMTFVTNPECFPLITKSRDGLSFFDVAVNVSVSVLAQDLDYASDRPLADTVHQQYNSYLTGTGLDEITEKYQENLGNWFQLHYEREASGVHNGTVTTGLLDFCTRAIFSSSTRALFGDILVDQDAKPDKWDATFTDDFFASKALLPAFKAFDDVFPLLYGGLPHFLLKKGVQARDNMINVLKTLKPNSCTFFEARKREMVDHPPTPRAHDLHNFAASQNGFLWAVQGNTIPCCFWTVLFLLRSPDQLERVKTEVRTVMAAQNASEPNLSKWNIKCNRDTLKKLVLLDCAIQEALRMATGSMMMRRSTKDQVLDLPTGPLKVKKGENIAIYPYLQHHDASLFPDPESFQLDRWIDKPVESSTVTNVKGEKLNSAFLPFGSGISMCPGRHFARNEIKTFLVGFFTLFDLQEGQAIKNPGYLLSRAGLGIFPPATDVQVTFSHKK